MSGFKPTLPGNVDQCWAIPDGESTGGPHTWKREPAYEPANPPPGVKAEAYICEECPAIAFLAESNLGTVLRIVLAEDD